MPDQDIPIKDGFGLASIPKYGYQAGRVMSGLSASTRLTSALDLASGSALIGDSAGAVDVVKGLSNATKGVAGGAQLSNAAKVAGFATKAAPIVAKGSAVLGGVLGAVELGSGIKDFTDGKTEQGKEKMVGGTADIVTAGALGVAATSSATVVGLPVAGVALGVAGVAQAAKYGYKYRHEIADGARKVGGAVADGAHAVGDGARAAGNFVADGAKKVGGAVADGAHAVGDGAHAVSDKVASGFDSLKKGIGSIF